MPSIARVFFIVSPEETINVGRYIPLYCEDDYLYLKTYSPPPSFARYNLTTKKLESRIRVRYLDKDGNPVL